MNAVEFPGETRRQTLAEYPPLRPAEDFAALMEQSTQWLTRWCEGRWTDFNAHDPGIMVLEQLTYALTELSFRAGIDLPQLLTQPDGDIPWQENSIYSPTEILPMRPVTADDYVRLLYDRVPELVAAQVVPSGTPPSPGVAGGLQASLVFDPAVNPKRVDRLLAFADAVLADHRNLGERFEPALRLEPVGFELVLGLVFDAAAQPDVVIATVHAAVKRALLPGPRFKSLEQALHDGMVIERALSGPRLQHGIIAEDAMPAPCTWLEARERASRAILAVPGIVAVTRLGFVLPPGAPLSGYYSPAWSVQTAEQEESVTGSAANLTAPTPELAPVPIGRDHASAGGRAFKFKFSAATPAENLPDAALDDSAPDPILVRAQAIMDAGGENPAVRFSSLLPGSDWPMPKPPLPPATPIGDYYSVQHQFPRVFRLEANALAADAPAADIVAVRQLKGYLLPFEQFMANYFSQLAHLADFLSNRPQNRTVFTQPLTDVPDALPLFLGAEEFGGKTPAEFWADRANPYVTGLETLAEDRTEFAMRRHRVLDHLLARFNESFPRADAATYETIANKEALLQKYCKLGEHRASAAPLPHGGNRPAAGAERPLSGLEEKLGLLLRRDVRTGVPRIETLGHDRESRWPTDFYFVFEPIRFLPGEPSGPPAHERTVEFPATAFGPCLYHVLINWTYQPLNPGFCRYAENLILENAPAHLFHRFIWIETRGLAGRTARPAVLFLGLARAWYAAGAPALEGRFVAEAEGGPTRLQARRRTPAARLFAWLNQPVGEAVVSSAPP